MASLKQLEMPVSKLLVKTWLNYGGRRTLDEDLCARISSIYFRLGLVCKKARLRCFKIQKSEFIS